MSELRACENEVLETGENKVDEERLNPDPQNKSEKYVTESQFLQQIMAQSSSSIDAFTKATTALLWNAVNSIALIIVLWILFH